MALCESQLEVIPPQLKSEESSPAREEPPLETPLVQSNGEMYPLDKVPGNLPLAVDYRSPVSHFIPPAVEMFAHRPMPKPEITSPDAGEPSDLQGTPSPVKRKRGRPRVDKTSPEYLAKSAARKQAKIVSVMNHSTNSNSSTEPGSGEKRKRGRPRVDKTSPEYLAKKRAREIEALEKKAKKEYKRRLTADSGASSSNDGISKVKRKYTKRQPPLNSDGTPILVERVKGKRGRPRKIDIATGNMRQPAHGKIRVRSNLMPNSAETINLDSDEEPDLGSPSQQSDSMSLDENLRALRYIHEKYANIDKDDQYEAHLLAANFKKGSQRNNDDDEVLSVRSSEGRASVKELEARVEKLEDSSNSDSDSSSSSGSSSSGSSSSSSSGSSSSSDSSDSESDTETPTNNVPAPPAQPAQTNSVEDDRSYGAWSSYSGAQTDSDSDSDPEKNTELTEAQRAEQDEISESDNESPDKSFQCHICRKWYSTRVTLKIHRRVHQRRADGNSRSKTRSSDRYECDCCNETFSRREKLWEHKAEAHRGAMTVRCEVCRKCFEDDAELASHDKLHTPDERAGRCTDCGLTFPRYEQLRRHRSNAHANRLPHACAHCGKRFSHAHSLTRHLHNHAKQLYRCVVCKASFARADQLAEHLNSHLDNYKRLKP